VGQKLADKKLDQGSRKMPSGTFFEFSQAPHHPAHPTSPRSTCFCAIWDCISSSSSYECIFYRGLVSTIYICRGLVSTMETHRALSFTSSLGPNFASVHLTIIMCCYKYVRRRVCSFRSQSLCVAINMYGGVYAPFAAKACGAASPRMSLKRPREKKATSNLSCANLSFRHHATVLPRAGPVSAHLDGGGAAQ